MTTDTQWGTDTSIISTTLKLVDGTAIQVRDDGSGNLEFVARQYEENGVTYHALMFTASTNEAETIGGILFRSSRAIDDHRDATRKS